MSGLVYGKYVLPYLVSFKSIYPIAGQHTTYAHTTVIVYARSRWHLKDEQYPPPLSSPPTYIYLKLGIVLM